MTDRAACCLSNLLLKIAEKENKLAHPPGVILTLNRAVGPYNDGVPTAHHVEKHFTASAVKRLPALVR